MSATRRSFLAGMPLAAAAAAKPRTGPRFFVAALTPVNRQGQFDAGIAGDLLGMLRQKGVDGIVVMGTTGEFSSFTVAERRRVLEAMARARGALDVFCHVGCANLPDTLELLAHAADTGAEAALVLPPYYYKSPKVDGLERFFRTVLDAARIPVLLYHIPGVSGVPVTPELLRRLAGHPQLYGLKDSSGNPETLMTFLKEFPKLKVFTGSPKLIATTLEHGGAGAITGNGNVVPAQTAAVFEAFRRGNGVAAAQERLNRAVSISGGDLAAMKFMLGEMGLRASYCRLPFLPLTAAEQADARARVAKLKELA